MAGYDRGSGTTSMPSEADARLDRPVRLEWSALFAGTLMGWGVLLVLSLIGMVLGLSVIDPFTARPVTSNSGAALWGAVSAIVSSFIGGFAVVRLAGDRRRGVSLVHGTVSWALIREPLPSTAAACSMVLPLSVLARRRPLRT